MCWAKILESKVPIKSTHLGAAAVAGVDRLLVLDQRQPQHPVARFKRGLQGCTCAPTRQSYHCSSS